VGSVVPQEGLWLDWCSYEAAKYAVEHWHYSGTMPPGPWLTVGAWEDGDFIGAIVFARGANNNLHKPYSIARTEICELVRVALNEHQAPVTRMVAIALRLLSSRCPGLRLCISFADTNQGHVGAIYQAGNWVYAGAVKSNPRWRTKTGEILHQRQVSATGVGMEFGRQKRLPRMADCRRIPQLPKHKYLMPLDDAMREQIEPLRQPYPKREI